MNTSIDQDHEIRLAAFIRCARLMHDFGGAVPLHHGLPVRTPRIPGLSYPSWEALS
ncbi:MAG: hypothetical protein K9L32_02080 [Chromatiaceae bacterium]|nr:hypothetical protein [Chromatiaceae bacterium]